MPNEISEQCSVWFMNPLLHVQDIRQRKENGIMKVWSLQRTTTTHNGHGHGNL